MWEFSLNLQAQNIELAKYIYYYLKKTSSMGDVITFHEEGDIVSILVGVKEAHRTEMEALLVRCITKIVCTNFKSAFLDKFLSLPSQDKMGMIAFKKALLNFDRETDKFLIQRALTFNKNLYLESFYEFKLKPLRSKWTELVELANENRDYLISSDAFIDLLKFLVDNLDICEDEVDIIQENDGYKIYLARSEQFNEQYEGRLFNEEGLISSIIDLSPQKINIYCHAVNKMTDLLEKIYVERVQIVADGVFTSFHKK